MKMLIGTADALALPKEDAFCLMDLGVKKDGSSAEVPTMKQIYAVIQLMTTDAFAVARRSVCGSLDFFMFIYSCIPS